MANPALTAMAQRIVTLFDTQQAPAGRFRHVLDPVTGAIMTQREPDGAPIEDGELDMDELDLSLVAFASDEPLDAVAFVRQVDADGNGRLGASELVALLASLEPLEQESLALQLDRLERLATGFAQTKAEAAGLIRQLTHYRTLRAADAALANARRAFVVSLMAYARPGIG